MKRIFIIIIAILLPLLASATYINGINYDLDSSTKTATVIQGSYSDNINIYSQVTYSGVTYTVTSIGKDAFSNSDITSVTIPSTVTFINKRAFGGCTKLTSVSIPNSVTEIAAAAFYGSTALKNIVLPSGLKKIDENLFWGCTSLTSVTIPAGVTSIGEEAFRECLALPSIIIPSSVTEIGERAFEGCTSLKNIISEIQEPFAISDNVFGGIASDATLSVLEGTKTAYQNTAGWNVFSDGTTEIQTKRTIHVATAGTLPQLISAEKYYIEELTLTGELNGTDFKFIREMAGISVEVGERNRIVKTGTDGKLKSLNISDVEIKSGGPYYYVQDRVEYYDYESVYTKPNVISYGLFASTNLESIVLPNSITAISQGAFAFTKLTSLTIPEKVTSIGGGSPGWEYLGTFEGCSNLKTIDIPNNVTSLYSYAFSGSSITSITIPNSVTIIGDYAFSACSGMTSATIPSSVTSIGNSAFSGCRGLTSVTIPNSVTSISNHAFSGCSSLTSVTISNSLKTIGDDVFDDCGDLTSVKVPVTDLSVFCNNQVIYLIGSAGRDRGKYIYIQLIDIEGTEITEYIVPNDVTSIGDYAFRDCSGLISVTIPNSVTSIGNGAFSGCSGLTSVTIPSSVTSISSGAFAYCKGLTSVIIPNSVTSIGQGAFGSCSGLTSVTIPNSVTSIGNSAFGSCSGLTSVTIPNSVTSIGDWAFSGCSGLTSITIPSSVTSIGYNAFYGCSGLTSAIIPSSVTSIESSAFSGCSSLTSILSLNNIPPTCSTYSFDNVNMENCVLWVPKGCANAYKEADGWKDFQNIRELAFGDVNIDFEVNQTDLDATVDFIMDKDPEGFYENLADLNGDDKVDAADVVKLVTILNIQEGLNMDWQAKYSNQAISSLSCTLNNDGDKAIQLTKCELYCNHSLVSSSNFKVTLASGGSKKCSFDELASYSTKTGFSLVWYYTYNGEEYTYRCEIEE